MANIPNTRRGNTVVAHIKLKDGGLLIPWSDFIGIRVDAYSVEQRMLAAQCEAIVNEDDNTILDVTYSGDSMQYLGLCKVIVRGTYDSRKKTYDAALVNFVADTAQATGVIVVTDPEVNVLIDVQEVSTSVLDEAIAAAIAAAEHAEDTASKSPYIDETTGNWMVYNAATGEYVDSGVPATGPEGPQGVSPMEFGTGENSAYLDGSGSVASGQNSVAVGTNTRASGKGSHSEGNDTVASGDNSHAEGDHTNATGDNSHAEGRYTQAQNPGEHAEGHYNVSIPVKTRHTVGIGTANNLRKNAHTITNEGKHYIPGIGGYEGTENTAEALAARQDLAAVIATFVTRSVNDLANYYLKSETYTKTEVDAIVGALYQFHFEVYASLEAITSPSSNVLYLIGPTGSGADKYEEYVYSNSTFVKIGDTSIDLSGYVTTTALNTALATKVNVADIVDNLTTNDATKPLSAKQGKVLGEQVSQLGQKVFELSTASAAATTWSFDDYLVRDGETYYVKAVNEEAKSSLCLHSQIFGVLSQDKWLEIHPTRDGYMYFYVGSQPTGTAPQILISRLNGDVMDSIHTDDRIDGVGDDVDTLQEEVVSLGDKITISHSEAEHTTNIWIFNDISFVAGKTYYVKHLSGYGDGISLAVGASIINGELKTGEWVEIIAPESGHPYFFVGEVIVGQPIIDVAGEDAFAIPDISSLQERVDSLENGVIIHTINVSYDGTSASGRTIHYSGLTAISDAINSITDASSMNKYIVHVEGTFHFTDPLTVPMEAGGEYSIIAMKEYVDIEGDGEDKSCIFMDFPANAVCHSGKTIQDYQPIYFYGVGGTIRNMKIIGKNCRYSFHIETTDGAENKVVNVENCTVVSYGRPDYSAGPMSCFGTGIESGQVWNINNCKISNLYGDGAAFAIHTPLHLFDRVAIVNINNCDILGKLDLNNYQVENNTIVNITNCNFKKYKGYPTINYTFYNNNSVVAKHGDYTTILLNGSNIEGLYVNGLPISEIRGAVLRIISSSTGTSSVVKFDETSSAFDVIVGDSSIDAKTRTIYGWDTQYGYVYRDGGVSLPGQAFGTLDVDENSAIGKSLGKLLGDCSSTNKVLVVTIDGVDYTIRFNEDFTSKDNDYVLGVINAVIGSVATADVFCPAILYYPNINGLTEMESCDTGAILRGMGVVMTSNGMRKAKNTDGYIDGICIDDTSMGQTGRVITKGALFPRNLGNQFFETYDTYNTLTPGSTLGISTTNDGVFVPDSSLKPMLRCMYTYMQIIK